MLRELIQGRSPDVICLTEAQAGLLPDRGHLIESDPDFGYPLIKGRRKVLLWSSLPWNDVSIHDDLGFPSGRIVSGVTGGVRFVGVCIPWSAAHVSGGRKDRNIWEDHLLYLDALKELLSELMSQDPLIVTGDFNQWIPKARQPKYAYEKLKEVLSLGLELHTAGPLGPDGDQLIDHLVTTPDQQVKNLEVLAKKTVEGMNLSDHYGICAEIQTI
ncbi:endonuclease/exonuclease/phosphatase family protein [Gimesia maris]|uniref:Endonuclease/exonuclease/phosphatase domain-containing protein n=1 Tax=Gimesia maris TaxID=122 RepID=A0ABX5YRE1_9PLAN|nr:endonuclease/exonuclease/phosphatase family protein [Gimesia maris]EDL59265.1 exodeoxyribonuclease III [Gimesia maris DSM 8797]QEG18198.1 hypothetical protein GmarT_40840 [Gimesia maris]QGQ28797.1 endonuclease/exonuclease/phosphatase family protein [Gimesia maris]